MDISYDDALLLYLNHCNDHRQFIAQPLRELSARVDRRWHLRNADGLVAIIDSEGGVENSRCRDLQLVR